MPSSEPIHEKVIETLNEKRKVYSRKGKDNPYTSRSKDAKKKYLKTIQKTPYLYMLSDESIQENRTDMRAIKANMDARRAKSNEYTDADRGYFTGSADTDGDAKKHYYTKNYSTDNKDYLNNDYWKAGPVLLSNTELSKDVGKKIKFGMGMYESRGERPYRPNAGVKGLSSEYQSSGQQAFVRKVTVNWTCFDLEDLDYLQDRFMTLGRKVYVEWGWANQDMIKTPIFLKETVVDGEYEMNKAVTLDEQVFVVEEGKEKQVIGGNSAAQNLKKQVIENGKGNFDAIIGFVEGFEFSQREDGGFDCTTNLVVNGGNIFNVTKEKKAAEAKYTTEEQKEQSKNDFQQDIQNLHKILDTYIDSDDSQKAMVGIYDNYITAERITTETEDTWRWNDLRTTTAEGISKKESQYVFDQNAVIKRDYEKHFDTFTKAGYYSGEDDKEGAKHQAAKIKKKVDKNFRGEELLDVVASQCWVRWGWFEDNILNKHFALVDGRTGNIISQHRSVNEAAFELFSNVSPFKLCNNHINFKTVNINNFIFPGQFELIDMKNFYDNQASGWDTLKGGKFEMVDGQWSHREKGGEEKELLNAHIDYVKSREYLDVVDARGENVYGRDYDKERETIEKLQKRLKDFMISPENLNLQETGIIPYLELLQLSRVFKYIDTGVTSTGKEKRAKSWNFERWDSEMSSHRFAEILGTDYRNPKGRIRNIFVNCAKLQEIFSAPSDTIKENFNLFSNSLKSETNGLIDVKLTIKEDGGSTLEDNSPVNDEQALLDIIKEKKIYEFPVHTNDSFVESQDISSDIGSKMTQILLSKQYASQAVKDSRGNLIAQAVFDGITDGVEIINKETGENKSVAPTATASPSWLALNGGQNATEWSNFGIADGDEYGQLRSGGGAQTENLKEYSSDGDESVTFEDDNEKDAEQANKYFEELDLDYTITGELKKYKKKKMFEDIGETLLENSQIEDTNGDVYEISSITDDKFGLLFITNTLEMTGIAGIKPGDVWTTSYLPKKFKDNAHFWTTNVTQTIDSSGWKTTITGRANMQYKEVE